MKRENGFTLIEILLSVALIGILGVSVPSAISGAIRATMISNEHTLAESLARNQMDNIQHLPYDSENITPFFTPLPNVPETYNIETSIIRLDPKNDGLFQEDGSVDDDGLQQVTILVKHDTKNVFTLVDYKVYLQ